jgi:hypothetical protein
VSYFTLGGALSCDNFVEVRATPRSDVRFASKADMCSAKREVGFTAESRHLRHIAAAIGCPDRPWRRYCHVSIAIVI